ncbi:MAG: hypothetical protein JNL72_10945 [Flavipsychrobacter sp.]|nr:hypothetical protein [Flavipsychrobacter sp.]
MAQVAYCRDEQAAIAHRVAGLDSLMIKYFKNHERAVREADELYELLKEHYRSKEFLGYKIDVRLQRAILYALRENHQEALRISLEAMEEAEEHNLPERLYRAYWVVAIMYEVMNEHDICRSYLDKAYVIYREKGLESVYSEYCIRIASHYRQVGKIDSSIRYAKTALEYATKYHNFRERRDACLLLGNTLAEERFDEALHYKGLAAGMFEDIEDFSSAAMQLTGAAHSLLSRGRLKEAFMYSDSALSILQRTGTDVLAINYAVRYRLFEAINERDSAYHYLKKYHEVFVSELSKNETLKLKEISEQYASDKKEAVIKAKNQQLVFITCLLAVIAITVVIVIRKNRKIRSQNQVISRQVEELMKTLEQKQVLLSELQHRVKNNLQHVISILEIQKESVDFNNIDELIRGNQNRIHSMALLHKKLNISDNINEVDLKKYIGELSELVKESYWKRKTDVSLELCCDVSKLSIEKALPLGLIVVELVSNSMKHAFGKRGLGIIQISITEEGSKGVKRLYYSDNGSGYDFNRKGEKGLGMEIIKGLIDQLDARAESNGKNGFELTLYFK